MAENKEPTLMDKVFKGLDFVNDVEQIGNLYGVSEEDRNNSRLNKVITGEKRPLSHSATEAGAWLAVNVLPSLIAGATKVTKAGNVARRALNNEDAFKYVDKGVKALTDTDVIDDLAKAGNELSEAGVDAVKSANKGRIVGNTAKGAWKGNKASAQKVMDDAKDALVLNEILDRAEPRTTKMMEDSANLVESLGDKITPEQYEDIYNKMLADYDQLNYSAAKTIAGEKGAKTAIMTEALNKALGAGEDINTASKQKVGDTESLYRKPAVLGTKEHRLEKLGANMLLNFLDLGTDPEKYPMDTINKLIDGINKDNYFDQAEIDDMNDVEKIWFIKKLAKGKFDSENKNKSLELVKNYLDLTNNSEDNTDGNKERTKTDKQR